MFLEQIAIVGMFSKFRKFPDCACLQRAKFSKGHNRIDWNSLQLPTLKLNLGIFPSKYRPIVRLSIWPSYTSNIRTRVSKEGTTMTIPGKYASKDNKFQFILTFVYCNTWTLQWEKLFSVSTVFTLSIRTPDCLTILVLKLLRTFYYLLKI